VWFAHSEPPRRLELVVTSWVGGVLGGTKLLTASVGGLPGGSERRSRIDRGLLGGSDRCSRIDWGHLGGSQRQSKRRRRFYATKSGWIRPQNMHRIVR